MKHLFLLLILVASTSVIAQTPVLYDSTFTVYQGRIVNDSIDSPTEQIAYVTPNRDTMYVLVDMYQLISQIWNEPSYSDEKPVLIPVQSIVELKQSMFAKRED